MPLDADAQQLEQCSMLLSPDERARAEHFHFERDRRRYTVARAALRTLLGKRTGLSPAAIVFSQTEQGKPYIGDAPAAINFNVSHSADMAICAISRSCVPGEDIEFLHRDIDGDAIARRFFPGGNMPSFSRSLPPGENTPSSPAGRAKKRLSKRSAKACSCRWTRSK